VVGVPSQAKERLVNKIANVLDPPWWCPEGITVPIGSGDKVVLCGSMPTLLRDPSCTRGQST
jgi:hypothetical protein